MRAQRLGTREIEDFDLGERFTREFLHRFACSLPCLDSFFVEHEHERYGEGYYTYFAYALYRQVPYGVPGAYRILANLLSLARAPDAH